ncbi:MAG: lipid-A-disaccharide synthase N-terminal domain-containing protein [Kiritimatiellia bacterium]|nr:lipid-A-disaccharide synthase N-terminal domain-containing protein [Kiritimatiellia bacterium]
METLKHFIEVLANPMGMLGMAGQILFFSRFLVQWMASEKKGESTVPLSFWYLSIGGGVLLLGYALWRKDPVITLGQAVGLFVYVRNLMLIHRNRKRKAMPNTGGF